MNIYIEPRERLCSLDFIEGLAIRIADLKLSRVKTTDWLAHKIYTFNGAIYDWNGRRLYLGLDIVDRSYGNDVSCKWNDDVQIFVTQPPQRRPAHRMTLRLGLWDAAMKINGTPVLP